MGTLGRGITEAAGTRMIARTGIAITAMGMVTAVAIITTLVLNGTRQPMEAAQLELTPKETHGLMIAIVGITIAMVLGGRSPSGSTAVA